jgi:flagellar biosynthesis/type III secretory pathway protein FliH
MYIQKLEFLAFDKQPEVIEPVKKITPPSTKIPDPVTEKSQPVDEPKQVEEETPAVPLITEVMVEEAKNEAKKAGYDEGFQAGIDKAKAEIDEAERQKQEALMALMEQCKIQLALLQQSQQGQQEQLQHEVVRLALAVAKKMAAKALKEEALAVIEAVATKAVQLMYDAPHLTLLVHPDMVATVEGEVGRLTKEIGYRGVLMVGGLSSQAQQTDCQVAWNNGRLSHDTKQLWNEIEQLLETYVGGKTEPQHSELVPMPDAATLSDDTVTTA